MIKTLIAASLISLLAACSSMGTGTTTSRASDTSTMGAAPGTMQNGSGPRGSSGGGPN